MEREKNFSGERQGSDKNITAPIIMIPAVMSATWFLFVLVLFFEGLENIGLLVGLGNVFFYWLSFLFE